MATRVPARLTAAQGRRFAFPVGAAFLALGALLWWRGREGAAWVPGGIGAALLLAGIVLPARLGPVERAWMAFAERLSRITTPILMAAVYFLAITPTALALRLFGHRPLARPPGRTGFWITRASGQERSDLTRQF